MPVDSKCMHAFHSNVNIINFILDFASKLYRHNVGIPMETNCAPLVADLFLFCYGRDFMKAVTEKKRYDMIDVFNSTSTRHAVYIYTWTIYSISMLFIHLEQMVHRIHPAELQLNKANASDTEAAFF